MIGGWEIGQPVFVSKVEPNSLPEKAGLRVGDQILEINGSKSSKKELKDVSGLNLARRCVIPMYCGPRVCRLNFEPSRRSKHLCV